MSTRLTNELGRALLKALNISDDQAYSLTLTSRAGEPETVTVTYHAWDVDPRQTIETTRTWREVEEPTR